MLLTLTALVILLLLSFYLLARICDDFFVSSLEKISHRWKLSQDAAGATLMAMGSSAPELFVAFISVIKPGNHADVGMGTIVGSALFNILVIIGASSIVKKAVLYWQPVVRDTLFYTASIVVLLVFFLDGKISFYESLVFVGLYLLYVLSVIYWKKIFKYEEDEEDPEDPGEEFTKYARKGWKVVLKPIDFLIKKSFPNKNKYYTVFSLSILYIAALSWVLVESAVKMGYILNIPPVIISLTVLAAGTSVPDLMASIIVARKGKGGMAISNAIGSNIFDILIGLGLPWLIVLSFNSEKNVISVSTENLSSSIFLLFATVIVIFFLLLVRKWKIGHRSGYFLIGLYILYLAWAISRAMGVL